MREREKIRKRERRYDSPGNLGEEKGRERQTDRKVERDADK